MQEQVPPALLGWYFETVPFWSEIIIDAFVSKEIKDFGRDPWVTWPTVNNTHIGYRILKIQSLSQVGGNSSFLGGKTANQIAVGRFEFRTYQPVSQMTKDAKGFHFKRLGGGEELLAEISETMKNIFSLSVETEIFESQYQDWNWSPQSLNVKIEFKTRIIF